MSYDLVLKNVRVVNRDTEATRPEDIDVSEIAINDGKVVAVGIGLSEQAGKIVDGQGRLAFPGVVDAHSHWGIYNPLEEDVAIESRACAQGGVTTSINYMRTGQLYMNRGGSYEEVYPQVLEASEGRSFVDYAYHLAPMSKSQIGEIPKLITEHGVSSFKIFMFYGGYGLHGRSSDQNAFLMTPPDERYDLAHFEFVMRGVQAAREQFPDLADQISLSLHCETAEIMTAYTAMVEQEGKLTGLDAYSASRPPHSEGLAVSIASYLAHTTELPNINLLHLSGATALDAAMRMQATFPEVNFRREVTAAHLLIDTKTANGIGSKVNPPIRSREDVDALWEHVFAGNIDWVCSDHACCKAEEKFGDPADDVFKAKSGFGGAEYLLPGLFTEGAKRGLPFGRMVELSSWNPAQRFGLNSKGAITPGYDADIALVDPNANWTVKADESFSAQDYSPFEGLEMTAEITDTFVRGHQVLTNKQVTGEPIGQYLRRPEAK